jgi:hypothetical protein
LAVALATEASKTSWVMAQLGVGAVVGSAVGGAVGASVGDAVG